MRIKSQDEPLVFLTCTRLQWAAKNEKGEIVLNFYCQWL